MLCNHCLILDCHEFYKKYRATGKPAPQNGIFSIQPDGLQKAMQVYCEFNDKGGWTRIQHRSSDDISFDRTWEEYKWFFGNTHQDYWIGLEPLYYLTQICTKDCK